MQELSSLQNSLVKYAVKLRNRKMRDKEHVTLLEGYRELSRALEYKMVITKVFFCPEQFLGSNENALLDSLEKAGATLYRVTKPILTKLAYRERPEGLIAIAEMKEHKLSNIPIVDNGLYLIAETIEKPGNLGSILRSADAVNATGVIICNKRTDIYNPNVIRASTGALFSVPLAEASNEEVLEWAKKHNIKTIAATPHTDLIYTTIDMTQNIAILVGAEQYGLSDFWMEQADIQAKIPMLGKIDSLNVATATTLLLYEASRQRNWNS